MLTIVINQMKRLPRISDTEWEIMNLLWVQSPATASEIIEALQKKDSSWHPKTARTLLNRLVQKKALTFKKEGRGYLYRPAVSREACVEAESDSFLGRLFGGSLTPMLAHMVERKKISSEEIEELRKILKTKA
jgi:BlaI family penicillinase repressor